MNEILLSIGTVIAMGFLVVIMTIKFAVPDPNEPQEGIEDIIRKSEHHD